MNKPEGKHMFGTVKVGEKGQIVIPKQARDLFDIKPGDLLMVLGDEGQGLALMKNDIVMGIIQNALQQTPYHPMFVKEVLNAQDQTIEDEENNE